MRWLSTEIALLALGIGLLTIYAGGRAHADALRSDGIVAFTVARTQKSSGPDQLQWSRSRVRAYAVAIAAPAQTPNAVLRIPAHDFAVPVYGDVTERSLDRGAGLIAGMSAPGSGGNIGIAAHRDGFFRILKDVAVGERIEVESFSGTRVYRVTALSIVNPDDTSSLRQSPASELTLVTCYPFYFVGSAPQRYIVRAVAETSQGVE
ncbi:MAG: class D sortase [Pseudomonadota bacterium]